MSAAFIHLRLHSEYSLSDGLVRIAPLLEAVRALGMPAVAVTDSANLFAMVKFYRAALAVGIKPIIGADLWLAAAAAPARLTLLCQDRAGYRNLCQLLSRAYTEGQQQGRPLVQPQWLADHASGLIALSGAGEGDVGQLLHAGKIDAAQAAAAHWADLFPGRYYLELVRTGRAGEEACVAATASLALDHDLPLVATNDVRFLRPQDFDAHEARVCIHQGNTLADPRRPRTYSADQYLKSVDEMADRFADLPEALANSVEIARRCNLTLSLDENALPDFPVPATHTAASYLREQATTGLAARLTSEWPDGAQRQSLLSDYQARLDHELGVIEAMGFPGYFLIVADFIAWARSHGVPVGPGRGSGAGSLVAWCLEITDVNPIRYDLLFERFLNPERVSMPDFDIDFCMDGRDRVIAYVAQRYGQDRVSQIITYGSMAARAVVRDVGRVLGHPYGYVDRIAKQIPFALDMTLERALAESTELRASYEDEEVRYLIDLARALEGLARNPGKHAGGVVIAPRDLIEFTPLYCEPGGGNRVTQMDKDDVEAVGLVKFDFLGLRTLTVIDRAVAIINRRPGAQGNDAIDIRSVPLDDPASYRQLKQGHTTALFQLESPGMRRLIKRLAPDAFEDIVALVALYRPGPLESGMVEDFIERKHGQAVRYPHPSLETVLKPTYGVILYQEQVMQIARELAGYSLGSADLLRRAMGKKKPEEMARQRSVFLAGAVQRGVEEATAAHIFDLIEKFAGYGFNKSHSAAYALVTYQTAWLKAHYPAAFMCAALSVDMDNTDKVLVLIEECRRLGIAVDRPEINVSEHDFSVTDDQRIRYGLGAIKGIGRAAIEALTGERSQSGPFADLIDLCRRIDTAKVNRRALDALIRAGALDALGPNRASLAAELGRAIAVAEQHNTALVVGQDDLFGLGAQPEDAVSVTLARHPPWPEAERLKAERDSLGLYLTGHPIQAWETELACFITAKLADLQGDGTRRVADARADRTVVAAGLVVEVRRLRRARRVLITLDDRSGRMECALREEQAGRYPALLQVDQLVVVSGKLSWDTYSESMRLRADQIMHLDQARERYARRILLQWSHTAALDISLLNRCLGRYQVTGMDGERGSEGRQGGCPVTLRYRNPSGCANFDFEPLRVQVCEALLGDLRELLGAGNVDVHYRRRREPATAL